MPRLPRRSRRSAVRIPVLVALALVAGSVRAARATPGGHGRHPQDGPHADLQVRVEDTAVHVLLQCNLAFADELVEPLREDLAVLHPVEAEGLREALEAWCAEHCHVELDGLAVPGAPESWELLPPAVERLAYYPRFGARALTTLRLGLRHPCPEPPRSVALAWDTYPPNLAVGDAREVAPPLQVLVRFAGYGEHELLTLDTAAPRVTWRVPPPDSRAELVPVPPAPQGTAGGLRSLRVPAALTGALVGLAALLRLLRGGERARAGLLLGCAAALVGGVWLGARGVAPLPDTPQVRAAAEALLRNVYRAFDHTVEEDVYATLARSVEGPLLEELYGTVHQSLVMQEEEGALSLVDEVRVDAVDVEEVALDPDDGRARAVVRLAWQVDGSVVHAGHGHFRTTGYVARYHLRAGESGWRIQRHEPLEQTRLATRTDDPTRAESDPGAGTEGEW